MKTGVIAVSAGVLLAVTGGLTLFVASTATPHTIQRSIYYDQPKHPVTAEMRRKVEERTAQTAPFFEKADTKGNKVAIGGEHAAKPQFVYFVLDGCPCSVDAEPLLQRLYEHFGHRIEFIAVTDGDQKIAAKWSIQMLMPYPIIPDPDLEVVRAFGAVNSVYSALIDQKGSIVKMWPGYSQDILADMNERMAKLLGEQTKPFDASYAPKEQASGCAFPLDTETTAK